MKFLSAASSLCLASMAMATPIDVLQIRQGATAVGTVNASIAALVPALPQYEAAVESAVTTILFSVSVQAQVVVVAEGIVKANLAAIANGLNSSATTIAAATVNAAGGVQAAAAGLVQAEIDMLEADILVVEVILAGINATFTATATIEAAVGATYEAEYQALVNAIKPFLQPIILFAEAAVEVTTGASVSGLATATAGLQTIANNFYNSLGVSS